ncbi:MAG: MBL fold metallo-hydrolase [Clostridia bacterium]|nr:MBL fold metallo-hydrolase [Clostridia bacterium]MBR0538358.1 MBL fold metallo-hydrolase [Clostridia bacterium]
MAVRKMTALFVCVCLLAAVFCACGRAENLTVTFLKVGKADAIVLRCGLGTVIIDTGETDDGEDLTAFLKAKGESTVDALILTHFDKDHIGGAEPLLEAVSVGTVLMPDYAGTSDLYASLILALSRTDVTVRRLTGEYGFSFGGAQIKVNAPAAYDSDEEEPDNDYSLIVTVIYGETRMLFMGDAEDERIGQWLTAGSAERCGLIKMPHHGVYGKQLTALLDVVSPAYAVICDSDKNPAEEKTLALLQERNVSVFETKNGDVTAVSDGNTIKVTK